MDEAYRVYICHGEHDMGYEVDIPEATVERFKLADKEFKEAEEAMYAFYLTARKTGHKETRQDASSNL